MGILGLALSVSLGAIAASRNLHEQLLSNIVKCPMSFFDTTPLGRIVNRFSKDVDVVDTNLPQMSQSLITTLAPLISTLVVIIYSFPISAAFFVPLAIFFAILQVLVKAKNIFPISCYGKTLSMVFVLEGVRIVRASAKATRLN